MIKYSYYLLHYHKIDSVFNIKVEKTSQLIEIIL